jgi:hypothetical protein
MWSLEFVRKGNEDGLVIIIVYVNDILISSTNLSSIISIKEMIRRRFEVEDQGEINYYLGINITRESNKQNIFMSQQPDIEK